MEEAVKKNIIYLALDNLIKTYSIALEDEEICQEDREFMQFIQVSAANLLKEYSEADPRIPITKPEWNRL